MVALMSALRDRWVRTRALYSASFCRLGADGSMGGVANGEKRKSHVKSGVMRTIALAIAFVVGLILPAFAQKAEIEAVNAKWVDFFNKGDFAGVASLYTDDATAFPPGSGMVKGRAAIEALWKSMAEQVTDPKLTTLDVKPLGPSAAREIGTFSLKTKGFTADVFPRFSSISYSRCCPSFSVLSQPRSTAEMWTNTSLPPACGWINP